MSELIRLIESLIIAFSMYSKIPMPNVNWSKDNMKYALCFFPLVGGAIGLLFMAWAYIVCKFQVGTILFAGIATVLPVLITGGIHIDGFCDTVDARSSHQSVEKKLEILKDPHIGAFAMIYTIVYFIITFSLWNEINITQETVTILALGFMLSRSFSALGIVSLKCAKDSGLAYMFANGAEKKKVKNIMYICILLISLMMLYINIFLGSLTLISIIICFIIYKRIAYNEFGGITGDLAGYFLQLAELFILIAGVIGGGVL